MRHVWIYIVLLCGFLSSCARHEMPKPYGYYRIAIPDTAYVSSVDNQEFAHYPYRFMLSQNAILLAHEQDGEQYWVDVHYPAFDADIHCSYKPVRGNLRELTDDAVGFVYKHAAHATSIPEHAFDNDAAHVHGVFFQLVGNTASPYQFFVTDSVHHFFRGSVYCNCRPNADSLAPVYAYLEQDVIRLIESLEWRK